MSRLLAALAAVALLAGCTSTKAALIRHEFAWESERMLQESAEASKQVAEHYLNQAINAEVKRMREQMERTNAFIEQHAAADPGLALQRLGIAMNQYHSGMNTLGAQFGAEREKIASLYAEQVALAGGYRVLSSMADAELTVPKETAKIAATEALKAATEVWRQYQINNPAPVPDGDGVTPPAPPETGYNGGGGGDNVIFYPDGLPVQ